MKQNDRALYIVGGLMFIITLFGFLLSGTAKKIGLVLIIVLLVGIVIYGLSVKVYRDRLKKNIIILILAILIFGGTAFYGIYRVRSLKQEMQNKALQELKNKAQGK